MGTAAGLALAPADAALPLAESRLLRVSGRLALAALAALSLATAGVVLAHRAP
jgi:hypothetical protein